MTGKSVAVSVPGKVHLMGEHAVVYGKPALLSAVDLRLRVTVRLGDSSLPSGLTVISDEPDGYVRHAVDISARQLGIDEIPSMELRVESDIPAGFHLGSSAAVAVATVGACMYAWKSLWNPAEINRIAYEVEKKQHGNPSGGDNTTVTLGGFVWFRKELEFLKSIWQLPLQIPAKIDHFFLVDTGRPAETTGEMVAGVGRRYDRNRTGMERWFTLNEAETRKLTMSIKTGDEKMLLAALHGGQRTLEGMGVVAKSVIPCVREIEAAGGAAKVLGGGGRAKGVGFLLGYGSDDSTLKVPAGKYGFAVRPVILGAEGIRLEK